MNTELQLEIENNCLLSCKHCSSFPDKSRRKIGYSIKDFILTLRAFQTKIHLQLTGGEPLLNPNLLGLISRLSNSETIPSVGLFTSGIVRKDNMYSGISEADAFSLKAAGLSSCYISIYHTNPIYHDFITNLTGSYQCVINSIQNLLSVGIVVKVHLVINKNNIRCLELIIDSLTKIGVSEIRLLRIVKTGNAIIHWKDIGVSLDEQKHAILNILSNRTKFGIKITFSGFPKMDPCRTFADSVKCQAGIKLFYLTFNGDIFPCACTRNNLNHRLGHVSDTDLIMAKIKEIDSQYHDDCFNNC